jgi:signal transduction histidine kinase
VIDPIYDDSGTLIGFAKVTRDVTERHQAQDLLEQKNKELESFATTLQHERDNMLTNAQAIVAAIAHEIRQPLTRITSGGSAAQRFLKMVPPEHDKARAAKCRTSHKRNNRRLSGLVCEGRSEATACGRKRDYPKSSRVIEQRA